MQFIRIRKKRTLSRKRSRGIQSSLALDFRKSFANPDQHSTEISTLGWLRNVSQTHQPFSNLTGLSPQFHYVLKMDQAFLFPFVAGMGKLPSALQFPPFPLAIFAFFAAHANELEDQVDPGDDIRDHTFDTLGLPVAPGFT